MKIMKIWQRKIKALLTGITLCSVLTAPAIADTNYPDRPITLLVGYAPGGGTDIVARLLAKELSSKLGQSIVVENKPGAATHIATQALIRAKPDGYTLYLGTNASTINSVTSQAGQYDPVSDMTPISLVTIQPFALVVSPSFTVNSVSELVAFAKANPGKLNVALSGAGNSQEMAARLFSAMTGADYVLVPYKGAAPAVADLTAGRVDFMFTGLLGLKGHIESNRMRLLALTGPKRVSVIPEIPTVAEAAKLPDFAIESWQALYAPASIPKDIVDRINQAYREVVESGALQEHVAAEGMDVIHTSPQAATDFIKEDLVKVKKILVAQ